MASSNNFRSLIAIGAIVAVTAVAGVAIMSTEPQVVSSDHEHEHGDDHDHAAGAASHVEMTPEQVIANGGKLAKAGAGTVAQVLVSNGTIVFDSAGLARARARFAGLVREVRKNTGDRVAAGETLAIVESNDSLQAYAVKAPIEGVVIERSTSPGEIADDSPLFVIANPARVWGEVHVFSKDLQSVVAGQKVRLQTPDGAVQGTGTVAAIMPVTESHTQTVVARIALDDTDGRWRAGMNVAATVILAERQVPVAVPAAAIQTMDEKSVVFVQAGNEFEVRQVLLGATDGTQVEIVEGLFEDETYVAANSFLLKADAGKATAEHEH